MKNAIFIVVLAIFPLFIFANNDFNISKNSEALAIEQIEKLYKSNKIDKAKDLAALSLKHYPKSVNLHTLYAKLLFWTKNENKALKEIKKYKNNDYNLYKKIYIAWAIKRLKKIKNAKKRLKFIKKLKSFAKDSYDIKWIEINSYLKIKNLKRALISAKELSQKYPKSQEAQERYAQLLFWNKKYKKSLKEYKKLRKKYKKSYLKEIKKIKRAIYAKKVKKYKKRVTVTKKAKVINKPKVDIQEKLKYMIGIGFENAVFSDKRYKDNTKYIEATLPIKSFTLYLKIEDVNRYNLNDKNIYGELYPKFSSNYWGYLSFSFSTKRKFFADYSIAWNQYYVLDRWQFGLAYELRKYSKKTLNILTAEYSYYFSDYLFLKEKLTYVLDNKSFSHLLQLKYQNLNHLEFYFSYIYSHSYERDNINAYYIKANRIELGGEYPLNKHFSLGASLAKSWLKSKNSSYTQKSANIFLRYYW